VLSGVLRRSSARRVDGFKKVILGEPDLEAVLGEVVEYAAHIHHRVVDFLGVFLVHEQAGASRQRSCPRTWECLILCGWHGRVLCPCSLVWRARLPAQTTRGGWTDARSPRSSALARPRSWECEPRPQPGAVARRAVDHEERNDSPLGWLG